MLSSNTLSCPNDRGVGRLQCMWFDSLIANQNTTWYHHLILTLFRVIYLLATKFRWGGLICQPTTFSR
jgi:hypothetical protein